MTKRVEVYLECGADRTFAAALDWPGWCRSGSDEAGALEALLEFGPRYATTLARTSGAGRSRPVPEVVGDPWRRSSST